MRDANRQDLDTHFRAVRDLTDNNLAQSAAHTEAVGATILSQQETIIDRQDRNFNILGNGVIAGHNSQQQKLNRLEELIIQNDEKNERNATETRKLLEKSLSRSLRTKREGSVPPESPDDFDSLFSDCLTDMDCDDEKTPKPVTKSRAKKVARVKLARKRSERLTVNKKKDEPKMKNCSVLSPNITGSTPSLGSLLKSFGSKQSDAKNTFAEIIDRAHETLRKKGATFENLPKESVFRVPASDRSLN